MNDLHCHKKVVTYLTKILKWIWCDAITKSTIYQKTTLHERKFSRELLVFSKGVLKNFVNFLFFSGFCRILKNTFPLEHSWASASDFIFDIFKSNKYMKVSFLLTVFYRKSKIKQKSRVALKLGNLRFALQWSSSFVELLLSSC